MSIEKAEGRSILLTRVIKVTPEKLWRCWTDPALLPQWFGPVGHHCITKEIDLRQGGHWLFDMIGPKGEVYPNLHGYTLYDPPKRLDYTLSDPNQTEPHAHVAVTLTPVEGGTRITMEMSFASQAIRDAVVNFGAVELGQTTLDKLAELAQAG